MKRKGGTTIKRTNNQLLKKSLLKQQKTMVKEKRGVCMLPLKRKTIIGHRLQLMNQSEPDTIDPTEHTSKPG